MSAALAAMPIAPPAQKIVASPARAGSSLSRGTTISGQLHFEGSVRIDGNLDGEIDGEEITIGESGVVTAQICAESIVVCGKVEGDITATDRIEIRATAKVTGNLTAPRLIIQEGAIFQGRCSTRGESRVELDAAQRVPRLLVPVVVTENEWRELTSPA